MSLRDRLAALRKQRRKRRRLRDRQHSLHHGARARREARAVKKLNGRVKRLLRRLAYPRVMYDAVTVGNIPREGHAVAGYVGGLFHTLPILRHLFADHARVVSIAVNSGQNAEILDIEPGDATIEDAPRWFRRQKTLRPTKKPGFYISASEADELVRYLAAHGIKRDQYRLWTAHWGHKHVCGPKSCGAVRSTTADCTQWTTHDEHYDESVCRPTFWEGR